MPSGHMTDKGQTLSSVISVPLKIDIITKRLKYAPLISTNGLCIMSCIMFSKYVGPGRLRLGIRLYTYDSVKFTCTQNLQHFCANLMDHLKLPDQVCRPWSRATNILVICDFFCNFLFQTNSKQGSASASVKGSTKGRTRNPSSCQDICMTACID